MAETWPIERIDMMKQLIADGLTSGQIAARMGLTRNQILGKSDRLGLKMGGGVKQAKYLRDRERRANPEGYARRKMMQGRGPCRHGNFLKKIRENRFKPAPVPLPMKPSPGISLWNLTNSQCHWPMWADKEVPNLTYCGRDINCGDSYCAEHYAMMRVR